MAKVYLLNGVPFLPLEKSKALCLIDIEKRDTSDLYDYWVKCLEEDNYLSLELDDDEEYDYTIEEVEEEK